MDKWTLYLEQWGQIDFIYTDFEKAFDKVRERGLFIFFIKQLIHNRYMTKLSRLPKEKVQYYTCCQI
jgi:hypothetical protein